MRPHFQHVASLGLAFLLGPSPSATAEPILAQLSVGALCYVEIHSVYQIGSQIYVEADVQNNVPCATVVGFVRTVLDLPSALSIAVLVTAEPPPPEATLLYLDGEEVADYAIDPENSWVYSYEFGGFVYIGAYPWVWTEQQWVYVTPPQVESSILDVIDHTRPYHLTRWAYRENGGWTFMVGKEPPLRGYPKRFPSLPTL